MAQIYNSKTIKRILDDAKIQTSHDNVPQELAGKVVPVLISNPQQIIHKTKTTLKTTTGAVLFLTTHATKKTYLHGFSFGFVKDATCDLGQVSAGFSVVIDGATINMSYLPVLDLTAERGQEFAQFKEPILLDKNSNISILSNTYSAGLMTRTALIYYSEEE